MIVFLIAILLFVILASFFILPVSIVADSEGQTYFISMPFYFKLSLRKYSEDWKVRLRIFLIPIKINHVKLQKMSFTKKESWSKKNREKRNPGIKRMLIHIKRAFRSFRIRRLNALIDTGDYPLNAQLVSVASQLNNEKINVGINFDNKNSIYFEAVTQLYKLIWILIRYKF